MMPVLMSFLAFMKANPMLWWPLATALISIFYNKLDKIPAVHAFLSVLVALGIDLPSMLDALKRLFFAAAKNPKVSALLVLAGLAFSSQACLASAPVVPVTPDNQAKVTACQSIASFHNDVVIGDFVLTGGVSGLAATAAALPSDQSSTKTTLNIVGAVVGAGALIGTGIAGYTAGEFSDNQCSTVVGTLPAGEKKHQ
jgi:hypothetical protein